MEEPVDWGYSEETNVSAYLRDLFLKIWVKFRAFAVNVPLIAANRSAANTQNKNNGAGMRDVVGVGLPLSMLRVPDVDIGGSGLRHQPVYLFSSGIASLTQIDFLRPSLLISSTCGNNYFPSSIRQRFQNVCCSVLIPYKSPVGIRRTMFVGSLPKWECGAFVVWHKFIVWFAFSPPSVHANNL